MGYISDTAPTISIPWLTTTVEPVSDKTTSGIEKQSKDQAAQEPTPCRRKGTISIRKSDALLIVLFTITYILLVSTLGP